MAGMVVVNVEVDAHLTNAQLEERISTEKLRVKDDPD